MSQSVKNNTISIKPEMKNEYKKAQMQRRMREQKEYLSLKDRIFALENENRLLREQNLYYREENRFVSDQNTLMKRSRMFRVAQVSSDLIRRRKGVIASFKAFKHVFQSAESEHDVQVTLAENTQVVKRTYQEIAEAVRMNTRSFQGHGALPLVSIIILTRNGADNLRRLFASLQKAEYYQNIEFIIIDNGSTDDTEGFLREQGKTFDLKIIKNSKNVSFSAGCNQGAQNAKGDYLLFLNDDIEVLDNWLDEMLRVAVAHPDAGAIGTRLVYPEIPEGSINQGKSFQVQHGGIRFSYTAVSELGWCYKPSNLQTTDALQEEFGEARIIGAVTAACMLMKTETFLKLGGFDEAYRYGYEDVDICLRAWREGYRNYYCPSAVLFHYEFGTQSRDRSDDIAARRLSNWTYYNRRWKQWLGERFIEDKITNTHFFCAEPLTIAFAVTETGDDAVAGDYFTAKELAEELSKRGAICKFLSWKNDQWYHIGRETDIVVALLQQYDPTRIIDGADHLLTIAWARNCFDLWTKERNSDKFSLYFASSKSACQYFEGYYGKRCFLLPIATNEHKFSDVKQRPENPEDKKFYECDYCFTGNRFGQERKIETELLPSRVPYSFKIFGVGWEKVNGFSSYTKGHVDYENIPKVYQYTKVVLDDANPSSTRKYGSINSRVFDAIASGCLVLTNNKLGAEETFEGLLPSFQDEESLEKLLTLYLGNKDCFQAKVKELQDFVRDKHTYEIRANDFLKLVLEGMKTLERDITIMICAPTWEAARTWGDYYFSKALSEEFEKRGFRVSVRVRSEWYEPLRSTYLLYLHGDTAYVPNAACKTMIWNISHPEILSENEIRKYDQVFIASKKMTEIWREKGISAEYLPQCTDPVMFHPKEPKVGKRYELLFVGNTRGEFRKIIQDLLPSDYRLTVIGNGWEEFLDLSLIGDEFVENDELTEYYQASNIVLNDHWEDMKEYGFVSNRIYDILASNAFVVSDEVEGMDEELKSCIATYRTKEELREIIEYFMQHPEERMQKTQRGLELVKKYYTFGIAVDKIIKKT